MSGRGVVAMGRDGTFVEGEGAREGTREAEAA